MGLSFGGWIGGNNVMKAASLFIIVQLTQMQKGVVMGLMLAVVTKRKFLMYKIKSKIMKFDQIYFQSSLFCSSTCVRNFFIWKTSHAYSKVTVNLLHRGNPRSVSFQATSCSDRNLCYIRTSLFLFCILCCLRTSLFYFSF